MNAYALFPLIATIAYIPLLVTITGSRPWHRRNTLFVLFLIPAMIWSFADFFFRGNFFPQHSLSLFDTIVIAYSVMVVQFHSFLSSFYARGYNRWLPFAYISLAVTIVLVLLGFVTKEVIASGDKLYHNYAIGVLFLFVFMLALAGRNFYVFLKMLKTLDNPVMHNQIVSLTGGLGVLVLFTLSTFLPWGKEFPISHFGNLANAFILSYAVIRHELVDIRSVLRRGLAWVSLGVAGVIVYWLFLSILYVILGLDLNFTVVFAASLASILTSTLVYRLRGLFFTTMGKAFQGQSYDYRQQLTGFAGEIQNVFSLREQGDELLGLVTKATGCSNAGLFFLETGGEDFTVQLVTPEQENNPLSGLRLRGNNPIVKYLGREKKLVTRESLSVLPEFRSLWEDEKKEIQLSGIEVLMPLISRERLIGILALDNKKTGRYSLEDFNLLEEITRRVAVSMEKEYLREELRQREEELSVINRSSAIITSNLDIQRTYDSFITELKRVVDVSWAAITFIEENEYRILALSSDIGSSWQVDERAPLKGSGTEWVAKHRRPVIEPDLAQEHRFYTGKTHLNHGVRSIIYVPLMVKDEVIGSLIVASKKPNAYRQRHIKLLEQLASQVAMPIENSRLYAKAEEKARIDELTALSNRRALDEMIASEISRNSRYGGVFSLIILDLDSFKAYNDNYGHPAGDKLLKQIGSTLRGAIRSVDRAFRYGGDEFAILLPQTTIEAAYEVSKRVQKRVAIESRSGYVPVTASLGLASWPADGISSNDIITAADTALYHAKRMGGNQSFRASEAMLVSDDMMVSKEGNQENGAVNTVYALAAAVDSRDHYTDDHSKKVSEYAVALAEAINLPPAEISRLSTCAFLHDVGKIGINDEILNKQGQLTDKEWETIKTHPQLGAIIAGHASQLAHCIPAILHHHEKYDGSGYPEGLKGEDIPLEARILNIADAFAAMTSERCHSKSLSHEQALEELKRCAGTQFDPNLTEAFLALMKNKRAIGAKQDIKK